MKYSLKACTKQFWQVLYRMHSEHNIMGFFKKIKEVPEES